MWGLSEIINIVLGGGLVATIVALLTLRQTVRKASAEAERADAEADTVRIENSEKATRILIDNIVNPLKEELYETRKYLNAAKREMARLRKAIDDANSCRYSDDCPVLDRMRVEQKKRDSDDDPVGIFDPPRRGQHGERRGNMAKPGESADVGSEPDGACGQSPASASRSCIHVEERTGEREGEAHAAHGDGARAAGD